MRFDDRVASIGGNHDLDQLRPGRRAVQASDDPSIQDQIASLHRAGFVGSAAGQEVTSQVFQITRVP